MYTTNPSQGERHYLHMLLHHMAGAKSYTNLKTSPNGLSHSTFKETALALGLLESDEEWDECLTEPAVSFIPQQLHLLFVMILIFGEPTRPQVLWEKHKDTMSEDLLREAPVFQHIGATDLRRYVDNETLLLLQDELKARGRCLKNFSWPLPDNNNRLKKIP